MLKQVFLFCQKTIYDPHIVTLLHVPHINRWKRFGQKNAFKRFGQKKEVPIFSQLESFAGKQLLVPTHYSICHEIMYVFHLISKPFDLDLMRLRWIRTNSVGKKILQRNYLASNIQEH